MTSPAASGRGEATSIGVISFDLWSTLVRGNPAYERRRVELVAAALGDDDLAAVRAAIDAAAGAFDAHTERTGEQHGFRKRMLRVGDLLHAPRLSGGPLDTLPNAMAPAFLVHL